MKYSCVGTVEAINVITRTLVHSTACPSLLYQTLMRRNDGRISRDTEGITIVLTPFFILSIISGYLFFSLAEFTLDMVD